MKVETNAFSDILFDPLATNVGNSLQKTLGTANFMTMILHFGKVKMRKRFIRNLPHNFNDRCFSWSTTTERKSLDCSY